MKGGAEGPAASLDAQNSPPDLVRWKLAVVPLSALGIPAGTRVTGFYIRNISDSALPAFFVDDVSLARSFRAAGPLSLTGVTFGNGLPAAACRSNRRQRRFAFGGHGGSAAAGRRSSPATYLSDQRGGSRLPDTEVNGHHGDGYVPPSRPAAHVGNELGSTSRRR
jgi:hypothetical protein